MRVGGIGLKKGAGLLGRALLLQLVSAPVHLVGALICVIVDNEIALQGPAGTGFRIGLLVIMILISAFVYFRYAERVVVGMWPDKGVFAIFMTAILAVDVAIAYVLVSFWMILAIAFHIYFGSPVRYVSQCSQLTFFDRVDRCRGRDFSFMQARDRAIAVRGKPSFRLSRLGAATRPEQTQCKTPEAFRPISCARIGVRAGSACYFCKHRFATYDDGFNVFIVPKDRKSLIYLHSMNVDFRNPGHWPRRLGRYFDFAAIASD
jgi:hypothetical protein